MLAAIREELFTLAAAMLQLNGQTTINPYRSYLLYARMDAALIAALCRLVCGRMYVLHHLDIPAVDPALRQRILHRGHQRMHGIRHVVPPPTPNLVYEGLRKCRRARRDQRRVEVVARRVHGANVEVREAHARRRTPESLFIVQSPREGVEKGLRCGVDDYRRRCGVLCLRPRRTRRALGRAARWLASEGGGRG